MRAGATDPCRTRPHLLDKLGVARGIRLVGRLRSRPLEDGVLGREVGVVELIEQLLEDGGELRLWRARHLKRVENGSLRRAAVRVEGCRTAVGYGMRRRTAGRSLRGLAWEGCSWDPCDGGARGGACGGVCAWARGMVRYAHLYLGRPAQRKHQVVPLL
eukprot:564210-Prymnesium_polylepis.1